MLKWFRKLKKYIESYKKSAVSILTGIVAVATSAILTLHSEWQLNMMQNQYIWGSCQDNISFFQKLLSQGYTSLQYVPFQDGKFFRMLTGNANDIFLALIILGWILGMVGIFFIMYGLVLAYQLRIKRLEDENRKV